MLEGGVNREGKFIPLEDEVLQDEIRHIKQKLGTFREVTLQRLDLLIGALADATLTHDDVFSDKGHGALMYSDDPMTLPADDWGVAVTGPRRNMMRHSCHRPYFAVPFGDMMIAGCFGMLRALPDLYPEFAGPVLDSLSTA